MIPFFDVHTHRPWYPDTEPVIRIENIHQNTIELPENQIVSAGLHPWFLKEESWEQDWERIWKFAQQHRLVAIGETGLDRICDTQWTLQQKVFQEQIEVANKHQFPLLIHCVRAFPEAIQILKQAKAPVVFHGFSGKLSRIQAALDAGYFISFGKAILNQKSPASHSFSQIPLEQIFLETDGEAISIESVYHAAAKIKNISVDFLKEKIIENAKVTFRL